MKRICFLLLLPLLLLCLTGCLQADPVEEEEPILTPEPAEEEADPGPALPEAFALPYVPRQTLDPITCSDGMQQVAASLIFEGLFRLGPDFQPQTCLCETYTQEGNRWVFTLRSGVTFSDGSALTARDVRATLERAKASARYGARLAGISRITTRNDTVTITLSSPCADLPALLDIPIVKSGTEKSTPLGTGPYFFEEGGERLVANQSWWRGTAQPVDRIALVEASDQDTMLYRFTSHDVQLIMADLTGTAAISTTGSVDTLDADTTVLQYIGCNTTRAPLDDPALRARLWRSMDREEVVSTLLSGHGTAAQFPISPASPLYPKGLEASASVEAADPAPERSLVLLVNEENRFKVSAARRIAADFTAAGVPVDINVVPWETYVESLEKGTFDLYFGEVRLTADWDLRSLLGGGGALNYGGWANAETDRLMAEFAAAEDRKAAAEALCLHLKEEAPILPVCFKAVSTLTQSGVVEGLVSTAGEVFYNLGECRINLVESAQETGAKP